MENLLIISQVKGEFQAKEPQLQQYLAKVKELVREFEECTMECIAKEQNTRADLLSKLASTRIMTNNKSVIQEVVDEPSISVVSPLNVCSTEQEQGWQQSIMEYLTTRKLPEGEKEAKVMRRMASFYTIVAGKLYHRGYSQPPLKCINGRRAQVVIEEMHEGICGNHVGSRALMAKILQASYFCPTMK